MERLVFVGPGRVGLALGYALWQAEAVDGLLYFGRQPEPPGHPLFHQGIAEYRYGLERPPGDTTAVLLTVPDRVLPEVSAALAARGSPPPRCVVLHTAGARGADPLAPLHQAGYQVGTLHPLQAIANPVTGAERLFGAGFALSGEADAMAVGRRLVSALSGRSITVPPHRRPLYHASAVLASNYLIVLVAEAVRLFEEAGATPEEAEEALLALAMGTLQNARELGLDVSLTGPVVRGDVDTVDLHLRALGREDGALYALLGSRTLEAAGRHLSPDVVGEMDDLFRRYR